MTQFIVPQFIDVEPKILGPLTVRQFILSVIGGIILFFSLRSGNIALFILMIFIVGGLVVTFGFLKINGLPFHLFLLNLISSFKKPNLRVWSKSLSDDDARLLLREPQEKASVPVVKPKPLVSSSRLAELSLIVDTRGQYKGEGSE
jgi:hypothetical protein